MKIRLLSLALLAMVTGTQAYAQLQQSGKAHATHNAIASQYLNGTAKKTTAKESRIIAECYLTYDTTSSMFIPEDSTFYTYSGTRGGDLNHPINSDSGISYDYDNGTYLPSDLDLQTFDQNNNALTYLGQEWDIAPSAYENEVQDAYTYNSNNTLASYIQQDWDYTNNVWVNSSKYTYIYDGNNNEDTVLSQDWSTTTNTWTNDELDVYTYTATNKVASKTTMNWDNTAWINSRQDAYTYDMNDNKSNHLHQIWNIANKVWVDNSRNTYTYDNMNDLLTDLFENYLSGNWVNGSLNTFSNFVAQMPQTFIAEEWDATLKDWKKQRKYTDTYNSYNQTTMEISQTWTGKTWKSNANDYQTNYYYDTYDPTAVKPLNNTGGSAHIYPVPAQDILHIDLVWDAPQACNIALYDVQGRVLRKWAVSATTVYHNTIPVNDLAPGNYFIKVTGAQGQIVQKLIVSK